MSKDDKKDHDTIPSAPPVSDEVEINSIGALVAHLSQFDQSLPISISSQFYRRIEGNDKQCLVHNFLLYPLTVSIITDDSGENPPFATLITDVIEEWTDVEDIPKCDCEECSKCEECDCEDEEDSIEDDNEVEEDVTPYTPKKFLLN